MDQDEMTEKPTYQELEKRIHELEQIQEERGGDFQYLANILKRINVGAWEWNVQTGEARFNERWAEIIGYSLSELDPVSIDTWMTHVHPEDLERSNEALQKHFSGELEQYECEVRMRHRDGHWVWVLDHGMVVSWTPDAKPLWICGTHLDISQRKTDEERLKSEIEERKRIEGSLRRSEEKFRSVFEHVSDYVLILDPQLNGPPIIVDANQSAAAIHGYSLEELIGKPVTFFDRDFDFVAGSARLKKVMENEHVIFETTHYRKDGSIFPVEVSAKQIRNSADNRSLILCIERDITERNEANQKVWELEEQFRLTFYTSPDSININRMDGTYLEINEGFTRLTGYTKEETIGKTSADIGIWEIPEDRERLIEGLKKDGLVKNLESRFRTKDGSYKIALMSAIVIQFKGEPHILSITRDITDIRSAESDKLELLKQLQQAQKMESVGRLAGGVAHDLNNMLGPIFGYVEMLLEDLNEQNPCHDYAEQILNSAIRAQAIVRQLLAFSRKQTLDIKNVHINTMLLNFEKLLRRTVREDIIIQLELGQSILPIQADIGQLEQVVMNLSVNAQDAMPGGGSLVFKTEMVELDQDYFRISMKVEPGRYVLLSITDNGLGMEDEIIENIFEPFFTTKEKYQGTGLGLSTVYGIIKQHKGYVWVDSEPDRGTTFKIYLPVSKKGEFRSEEKKDAGATSPGSETILLVEDEKPIREMIKTLLTRQGYHVFSVANGGEAVGFVKKFTGEIDLLLTDVIMPGIDGQETARQVSKQFPNIKVLYMSGYSGDVISTRGILDTETDLLPKPFTKKMMSTKIRGLLDHD